MVVAAALLDRPSASLGDNDGTVLASVFQSRQTRRGVEDDTDDEENVSSALCVYRISEVRDRFTHNIRRCFAGEQKYVGLQFSNRMCVSLVSLFYRPRVYSRMTSPFCFCVFFLYTSK